MLYKELAWIFFFKIGGMTDDQHWYYKRRLAFEWHEVLGALTEGRTTEQAAEVFKKIVDAPLKTDDWLAQHPEEGPKLLKRIEDLGYEPDEKLMRAIGYHTMFAFSANARLIGTPLGAEQDRYDEKILDFIQDESIAAIRASLISHLQHKTIVEGYRMNPELMHEIILEYGPLDFRHPAAHALYWMEAGTRVAEDDRYKGNIDALNLYRLKLHALQDLSKTGRLSYDPVGPRGQYGTLYRGPEPRYYMAYHETMLAAEAELERQGKKTGGYASGHENFMEGAIASSYMTGDHRTAVELYRITEELYGEKHPDRWRNGNTLEQRVIAVVTKHYADVYGNQADSERFISERLQMAFEHGLAHRRFMLFNSNLTLARQWHDNLKERARINKTTIQDPKLLLPFGQLVEGAFVQYMTQSAFDPLSRGKAWAYSPAELRLATYDRVRPALEREFANIPGLDVNRFCPPPPGIEEYRKKKLESAQEQPS